MGTIELTERASRVMENTTACCWTYRHEFVMPEHLLLMLMENLEFRSALNIFYSQQQLTERIKEFLKGIEHMPIEKDYNMEMSEQMLKVMDTATKAVLASEAKAIDLPHLTKGILELQDSWAAFLLKDCLHGKETNFITQLINLCEIDDEIHEDANTTDADSESSGKSAWRKLVTCMNEHYQKHNPLVGREEELKRTIQVLCRCDKNNPLHVGEPGVGKTALVWGLVRLIEEGKVPERLKGIKVYQLDMGTLLAGTQYRGEMENRIKQIMDGVSEGQCNTEEPLPNIVYIDEIHTLVGAGAISDSALDASNMLKPYLEAGTIRFIGSTTYDEYNRYFARSKGLTRRFQQIDIKEPSVEQTKNIIRQLLPRYEEFHYAKYDEEAIDFAVEASAKYITDRFLPDKAIDLIDEAGAAAEAARTKPRRQYTLDEITSENFDDKEDRTAVTKADIAEVLAKTCKVETLADAAEDDYQALESLENRLLAQIYGQDEAIRQAVQAVQMARAGLLDDNKPLASLLFVGPTGVGKTEVARVLAKEMGVQLIRFDMSEYTEKHAVAKLIGSPAGYVGYEDGGLLTDAIRKTPNCVLLLDEIEKAHQDIYNILLQVMDYARLTDNKGRKADFRNVILIMTSNAGAQFASQASIGFSHTTGRGEAMMKQVKKTFKPEFINRLSAAIVFRDMDKEMATLILQKKLRELHTKLEAKKVAMTLTEEAFTHLLKEGFTPEYGAREMDRVIARQLKPLLTREILFGQLKQGGKANIAYENGKLIIK